MAASPANAYGSGRRWTRPAAAAMCALALTVGIASARYFLHPPPWLEPAQIFALERHPSLFLGHVAGGVLALILGPLQFSAALRGAHPKIHRGTGYAYVTAVFIAGAVGLWLSPDTALFVAQGLSTGAQVLRDFGIDPATAGLTPGQQFLPSQFYAVGAAFACLALAWLLTAMVALICAIAKRYEQHRAWMIRNYSLTFAAVTVRLFAPAFAVALHHPRAAMICTFWSWLLNVLFAEWLLRRHASPKALHATA